MKKVLIVGAGISGLSFGYECLKRGYQVTIVENTSSIGGLARSVYHNDCWLDIGVHVLYLKDPEVRQSVKDVLPEENWIKVRRNGKLYLKGRYIDWPPTVRSLLQLPLSFGATVAFDQLFSKPKNPATHNYEEAILSLYGPTLYQSFFKPLTQKFLQTNPLSVHSDWAFSSLRAATKIEDKSFNQSKKYLTQGTDAEAKKDFDIFKFLLTSLQTNKEDEPFYYFKDGFGELVNAYYKKIIALGGKVLLNSAITKIQRDHTKIQNVEIQGHAHEVDELVWTGNPYALCQLLNLETPRLPFLHSKFVFAYLKRCKQKHQVCYYADEDISFVRGTILSNHSKAIIRNSKIADVICLEYTFTSPQALSHAADSIKSAVIRDLIKVSIVDHESEIESIFEINAPFSYPILTLNYRENIQHLQNQFLPFEHLTVLGRQATFNYENSDIIIKNVLHHPFFKHAGVDSLATARSGYL